MSVNEIFERSSNSIKNYGIAFKYESRKDVINMYKEFRDVTLAGAVAQMYNEMAGRHAGRSSTVHIIKTSVVAAKDVVRPKVSSFNAVNLRYPKISQSKRAPTNQHKSLYTASRPTVV